MRLLLEHFLEALSGLCVILKLGVQRRQFSVDIFDLLTAETLSVQDLLVKFDGFPGLVIDCVRLSEQKHSLLHLEVHHIAEELLLK